MEYKDYYQILGVPKNADEKEIKRAYRKLARQYHPDKNPNNHLAEERFKEINEAYEVIGNADNRVKYDQLGRNYHRFRQMGGDPNGFDFSQWFSGGNGGAYRQQVNVEDLFGGAGGFSDFFNAIFGGRHNRAGSSPFGQSFQQPANRDVEHTVNITLEEAYQGTTRTLNYEAGERFTAKIPAGSKTGTKVRLRGKGSGGSSDLYLVVQVDPHARFKRDGDNLMVTVDVDVLTAVLGGKVSVPTLTNPVTLTIPPGTQGGRTFRLKGKGMPHLRDNQQYGDLLAQINIRVPETLSDEERRLYEQLAALAQRQA
jgi:curved DNA-binding protein